jgi:hypothetical protein
MARATEPGPAGGWLSRLASRWRSHGPSPEQRRRHPSAHVTRISDEPALSHHALDQLLLHAATQRTSVGPDTQ